MKKHFLALFLCLSQLLCVFAETSYDDVENKIIVNHDKKEYINIMIIKDDMDIGSIGSTDQENNLIVPFYIKQFFAEDTIEIPMPSNAQTGYYKVYVGENTDEELKFFYLNIDEAEKYVKTVINSVSGESDLKTAIKDGYDKLALTFEPEENADLICQILMNKKPFIDYSDFKRNFNIATATVKVKKASDRDFENVLKDNAELLGIDYSIYSNLSTAEKVKVKEILCKADYLKSSFSNVFAEAVIVAQCSLAQHYSVLQNIIIANKERIGVSLTGAYNSLSDKTQVFIKMMKDQSSFNTIDDIKNSFNNAVSALSGSTGGIKSSGGGGGGGTSYNFPITTPAVVTPKQEVLFSDLEGVDWAKEAVEFLAQKGVLSGTGEGMFEPQRPVTRAEFAKMIYSAFNIEKGDSSFNDVIKGTWYYDAVSACSTANIVKGYDDGSFRPDEKVTRQDAAVMLYRAAKYKNVHLTGKSSFDDESLIDEYAYDAVLAMAANGMIKGYNNCFYPKNETQRAEAAVLVYNTLKVVEVLR